MRGVNRRGGRGRKSLLLCDPGSELRLSGVREKRRAKKTVNRVKNKKKQKKERKKKRKYTLGRESNAHLIFISGSKRSYFSGQSSRSEDIFAHYGVRGEFGWVGFACSLFPI